LIGKHENLENEYACATNVSSCVYPLEKESPNLKAQLEVLTSKHVKMQKDYEMLKCSHEDLQDTYVMLQVSHGVVVISVKHFQPHTQECACSPNFVNPICANACCSQSPQSNVEQINVDSCDDLIAEQNDTLKLEVKRLEQNIKMLEKQAKVRPSQDNRRNMMSKLENGSNFTKQASQQSNKSQLLKRQQKGIEYEKIKYAKSAYLNAIMSHIKNDIGYKMGDKHNSRVNTKGQKFIKFSKANVQQEKKQNTKITNNGSHSYANASHVSHISYHNFKASYVLMRNKIDKIIALHIGPHHKRHKTCVWVAKVLISNVKGSKQVWVPKNKA
jgi:hypothetical protein